MPTAPSSRKGIYVGVVVVLALLALLYWYYMPTQQPESSLGNVQAPALSAGNTTADIQGDLNNTPDAGSALGQDSNNTNVTINSL